MLRNFGIVQDGVYRSGKMSLKQLAEFRESYGISRVIDLRDRAQLFSNRSYLRVGLDFIKFPLNEQKPISCRDAESLLSLIECGNVLVHCWKGAHRTGSVIGLYRRIVNNWHPSETWAEMQKHGFGNPEKHHALFVSVFNGSYIL